MKLGIIAQKIIWKADEEFKTRYCNYRSVMEQIEKNKFETIYEIARFAYEQGARDGLKAGTGGAIDVVKECIGW